MTRKKLTIMNTKPIISDEEIRSRMNFSGLLADQKLAAAHIRLRNKTIGIVAIATTVLLTAGIYFVWKKPNSNPPGTESLAAKPNGPDTSPTQLPRDEIKAVADSSQDNSVPRPEKKKTALAPLPKPGVDKNETATTNESGYTEAEPVDGFPALYQYFDRELTYPPEAVSDSIQGVITVAFILTKEGNADQIKVTNSLGAAFDKEALRLIANMPRWKAARMNGKPIASKISLPLTFHYRQIKQ